MTRVREPRGAIREAPEGDPLAAQDAVALAGLAGRAVALRAPATTSTGLWPAERRPAATPEVANARGGERRQGADRHRDG
ncbi:hypothetical protein ACF1G0_05970 [Streptomyces sp. NPDC013953]|uniref:hypothetical protein n=1 Tax=Streptomyces sp. NPDC013953 TaxID=3364868 RepID=UPI0036FA33C2